MRPHHSRGRHRRLGPHALRKHEATLETLITSAVRDALTHAAIEARDVDEVVLGNFNAGMNALAFLASLVLQTHDALRGLPVTRTENVCASGSSAVHTGIRSLLADTAETVVVVGEEKMTVRDSVIVGQALLGADYDAAGQASTSGFAGLFAEVADAYAEQHGDHRRRWPESRPAAQNKAVHHHVTERLCAAADHTRPGHPHDLGRPRLRPGGLGVDEAAVVYRVPGGGDGPPCGVSPPGEAALT